MKFSDLFAYLSGYSSCGIIVAVAALAVTLVLKKTLLKKKLKKLCLVMPFIVGIVFFLLWSAFTAPEKNFGEAIKNGTSAGGAATVIYAIITGFMKDPSDYEEVPLDSLIIEGLLAGYVPDDALKPAAEKLAAVLRENLPPEAEREKLTAVLAEVCPRITKAEAEFIVKIILNVLSAAG
ncbi:MAG: hypothetical protein J6Z34_01535 [Clostridia bacterium]|nr:hypothetical protein [Clostridia bacterium]